MSYLDCFCCKKLKFSQFARGGGGQGVRKITHKFISKCFLVVKFFFNTEDRINDRLHFKFDVFRLQSIVKLGLKYIVGHQFEIRFDLVWQRILTISI